MDARELMSIYKGRLAPSTKRLRVQTVIKRPGVRGTPERREYPREGTLLSRKKAWELCTQLSGSQQMAQTEVDPWDMKCVVSLRVSPGFCIPILTLYYTVGTCS